MSNMTDITLRPYEINFCFVVYIAPSSFYFNFTLAPTTRLRISSGLKSNIFADIATRNDRLQTNTFDQNR